MIAAIKYILDECDETEGDVIQLANDLSAHYGFENIVALSHQDAVNKQGKGNSYSRV